MMEMARIPAFEARLDLERLAWRATSTPGVSWILVSPAWEELKARSASGEVGEVVALIRMEPGSGYTPHRHVGPEEVLVLQGGYADAEGEHCAGTWLRYPAGSSHAPVALGEAGAEPCVIFATARGGVELLGDSES
jgi:anti-sigma factor ChrR (cupin superfamily)